MIDKTLATGYLIALFELAESKGQLQQAVSDLNMVAGVFRENAQLREIILHPSVTRDEKIKLFKSIFTPHLSTLTGNFLLLIVRKRRERILDDLLEQYQEVADSIGGTLRATVRTAIPLTEKKLNEMKKALEAVTNKTIEIDTRISPEILGGAIVKIGNRVIDGSVASRLNNLKKKLIETGVG